MIKTSKLGQRTDSRSRPLSLAVSVLLAVVTSGVLIGCSFGGGATKPKITDQPKDLIVFRGQLARFAVGAEGKAPLAFQWLRDGVAIAGATEVTYSTAPVDPDADPTDVGHEFSVTVTNEKGSVTSEPATLSMYAAPTITTNPTDQSVAVGATATFTVVGDGNLLRYQWYRNDIAIAGAASASYTTAATVAADDGAVFTVDVYNGSGLVTSTAATLNVTGVLTLVTPPVRQSVNVGQPAIFSVVAFGDHLTRTYQWRKNGVDIAGATGSIYITPAAVLGDSGTSFDVVVTNAFGTATSAAAVLTVVSLANSPPPVLPALLATDKSSNPAVSFTAVLKSDGTVVTWGDNSIGQSGTGTAGTGSETPKSANLPAGSHAVDLAVGAAHVLALLDDGTVYSWGLNGSGQLGLGDAVPRLTPTLVTLPHPAVAIAAGLAHSVAVLNDGTVYTWGTDVNGELGNGPRGPVVANANPLPVTGITNAIAVAAGNDHTLVLLADGTVVAWGANGSGQIGNGQLTSSHVPVSIGLTGVSHIAAGGDMSMAVTDHRIVLAWGENSDSQLGLGGSVTTDVPTPAGVFVDGVDAAASNRLLLVVASDGHVAGAGFNEAGSLGDTTTTARNVFTPATGLAGILGVTSGGKSFSLALQSDGSVFSWGDNTAKQLGNTALAAAGTATPTLVPGFDAIP
ncbi:MAG TPA: hypothetical protein VE046_00545 [Steroidobacteraceae bacterium]|nr:hypothetical protein [Steroidobacteraceae bacterium]